jgi:hypothetical protein
MSKLEEVNGLECTQSGLVIVEHCPDDFPSSPLEGFIDYLTFDVTAASGDDAVDKMIEINSIAINVVYNGVPFDIYMDAVAELAAIDPYHYFAIQG